MVQRFNHLVIMRAPGLLPMWYTLRELEEELATSHNTVREWLKQGMPYNRDARGHLWVNGQEFAGWVEQVQQNKPRLTLAVDEAYCLRCRRAVKLEATEKIQRAKLTTLRGVCPTCGSAIHRGV